MVNEHIRRIIIHEHVSIADAMLAIESEGLGMALVVDDFQRLIGIVTDGDIRRGILRGLGLQLAVAKVVNRDPIVMRQSPALTMAERRAVVDGLIHRAGQSRWLWQMLPVVDGARRVVDLLKVSELQWAPHTLGPTGEASLDPAGRERRRERVLLVGGAGYIGSVAAQMLLGEGYRVRVLDTLLYGDGSIQPLLSAPGFEFVRGDVRHLDVLVEAVEGVNAVIYLAEIVGDPACAVSPETTLATNFLSTTSMATLCKHLLISRYIYVSSCSVYGESLTPNALLTEESPLNPVSLYAQMKVHSEQAILALRNGHFSPCIVRAATVFGLSSRPRFDLVVNLLSAKAITEGRIEIFGGRQWRPHVHVEDVARALVTLLQSPVELVAGEIFNVGSTELNHQMIEIGEIIKRVVPPVDIRVRPDNQDQRTYRVSFDKIRNTLGFKTRQGVEDGVREISDAFSRGLISDYSEARYNNYRTMMDLMGARTPRDAD